MIIFLLVLLSFTLGLFYIVFERELISPSFVACAMFIISTFVLLLYRDDWQVNIRLDTIVVIFVGLLGMAIGELIARKVEIKKTFFMLKDEGDFEIKPNSMLVFAGFLFVIVTTILYYREILVLSKLSSSSSLFFLKTVREGKMNEGLEISYIVQHMFSISEVISCIYIYIVLKNYVFFGKKEKNPIYLITVIVYSICTLMTTGRARLLNHIIYIVILYFVLYSKKRMWKNVGNIKMVFVSLISACSFLGLFYLAGFLTGKSLNYNNFFDNIANYLGSSIYALNDFLQRKSFMTSEYFGSNTLFGIFAFMRKFGFTIPETSVPLEYIQCGYVVTNIYTAFRRYVQDFGMYGLIIIQIAIGFVYTKLLLKNKKGKCSGVWTIFLAYFYFPIVMMSIEERFFMDVLLVRSVYSIVYFLIAYKLFIKKIPQIKM